MPAKQMVSTFDPGPFACGSIYTAKQMVNRSGFRSASVSGFDSETNKGDLRCSDVAVAVGNGGDLFNSETGSPATSVVVTVPMAVAAAVDATD
ncbi:hypothetical protein RHMOL_Rhmol11G0015100 [Rhododendron molle]|uniref:Uncharacterized protein n=1 Tax=Rhododendron molle TaxID=49168 RepID=A0ACC0LNN9_RHOML|nr:hypothetical protein RHMOL_Rhmol11G0015100 [Rhododendron molle]